MQGFDNWKTFMESLTAMLSENENAPVLLLLETPHGLAHFTNIPSDQKRAEILHSGYIVMEENFRMSIREQAQSTRAMQIESALIRNPEKKGPVN